jgi:hypothetical protein
MITKCPVCRKGEVVKGCGYSCCNNCWSSAQLYWLLEDSGVLDKNGNLVLERIIELKRFADAIRELSQDEVA